MLTPSQTVGPFFHFGLPYECGPRLVSPEHPDAVTVHGVVNDGPGEPIPDSLVEIWQADPDGEFIASGGCFVEPQGFRGFGRCETGDDGSYAFTTLLPGAVPTIDGTPQAPHLAMSVFARGMLRRVVTRVYFADAPADPLLASVDAERRHTLIATADDRGWRFDVNLQGPSETVFLDVFAR